MVSRMNTSRGLPRVPSRGFVSLGLVLLLVIGLAVLGGAGWWVSKQGASVPFVSVSVPPAGPITTQGILTCLPHKDTSGPQTLECGTALKDDEGRYYGLSAADYTIAQIPSGTRVEVEGTFTPQADEKYQSVGVIAVTKVTVMRAGG